MKKLVDQWDKAAKKYTKDQEQSDFVESNKRVVKARFQEMSGRKVLDLGCGYGYYTDYFHISFHIIHFVFLFSLFAVVIIATVVPEN